jgi:hypothetical protein
VTRDPCSVKAQRNDGMWRSEGALGTECRFDDRLSTRIRKCESEDSLLQKHRAGQGPARPAKYNLT